GGSFGFQVGGSETDVIMLVMSQDGAEKLLSSKFTLGAKGSVAAGPVGRSATAQTDLQMHATFFRGRGLAVCSLASPQEERRSGRTWTTTRRFMGGDWKIERSLQRV